MNFEEFINKYSFINSKFVKDFYTIMKEDYIERYIENNNIIKYSKIKNKEDIKYLNTYYFKIVDNWLYLYDKNKDKNDIISLNIITIDDNSNNYNNDKILFNNFIEDAIIY